ncbi:hypothetical protein [Cupriavidus sp. TMH.W2]|uniref:hypothetical protein n=1 Tax=Cupriavidus sp. TMH.W2 TaxID=3434465 RepID=UPI003D784F3C
MTSYKDRKTVFGRQHERSDRQKSLSFIGRMNMLRVRVELIQNGDETAARLLGDIEIANDGTGTEFTGNYDVVLREYGQNANGATSVYVTTAVIEDIERDIVRPLQVVGVSLDLLAPVKRTMASNCRSWGRILSQKET